MNGCAFKVGPFVRELLAGLDKRIVEGRTGMFTMKVPVGFSDEDIAEAAQMLHKNGVICMYGLSHSGNRYSMAFVAMRVFTTPGYVEFRKKEAEWGAATAFSLSFLFTSLVVWLGISAYFWSSIALCVAGWVLAAFVMDCCRRKFRNLRIPTEPVQDWVPYYDWD